MRYIIIGVVTEDTTAQNVVELLLSSDWEWLPCFMGGGGLYKTYGLYSIAEMEVERPEWYTREPALLGNMGVIAVAENKTSLEYPEHIEDCFYLYKVQEDGTSDLVWFSSTDAQFYNRNGERVETVNELFC